MREKVFTKIDELILVFYLLSNFQCPQHNDIALTPRLPLVAPPLHTPLHPGHLFLVGCCVENRRCARLTLVVGHRGRMLGGGSELIHATIKY